MFLQARPDRLCHVREVADHYGVSYNHMVKVVHKLAQLGYVESIKGKGGGIRLAKGTEKLGLGDIVRSLEPNMDIVECFNKERNTCLITGTCRLKHCLFDAKQAFIAVLNKRTLKDT